MASLYDAFPYRAVPIPEAHVDRLHLVAHLFGMQPAPVDRCRVLELGCADGGHLVPMAEALPHTELVGIDLSARQIADGRAWVEPLQLDNLTLLHGNAIELPDLGTFDYIVCHGLYSWVPDPTREALLPVLRRHLRPQGVVYVSYNTYPGWHTRRMIRDFILQHAAETDDPNDQVDAARAMLRFLLEASDPETAHGKLVREHCESLLGTSPQYLIHGLLARDNQPFYLHEFVASSQRSGLAYLGDAHLGRMTGSGLHEQGKHALASVPGGVVDHEQVLDFLTHRSFRQSLLVAEEAPLQRSIEWYRVANLWLAAKARLRSGQLDDDQEARFDTAASTFSTADPVLKVGLDELGSRWPAQLSFALWTSRVAERLGTDLHAVQARLGPKVLQLFADGVLELSPRNAGAASDLPERPRSTAWARRQLALDQAVTDLHHGYRRLPAALGELLSLCDGTRTHDDLAAALDLDADRIAGSLEALRIRGLLLEEAP